MRHLLALGVLVALAGACDGSSPASPSSPPTPLPPAPKASLQVGSTSPAMGLDGLPVTFDASASTGEGLSYRIEFGDGQSSAGAVSSHVGSGTRRLLTARATVTDRWGRGDTIEVRYLLATVDAPLFWFSNAERSLRRTLFLRRTGSTVGGTYNGPEGHLGVAGQLAPERGLQLVAENDAFELTGTFEWRTDRDWGQSDDGVTLRLTMRGGQADGTTFDFHFADPY